MCESFINLSKPIIAAVKGFCIGISFLLLGCCDLVYALEGSLFESPLVRLGLGPEMATSYTFTKAFGRQRTSEIFFRNKRFRAAELY